MKERLCKYDGKPIPEEKRSDSIYCSSKCGWKDRNEKKAKENKEKSKEQHRLDKNHEIIKKLYRKGMLDIPIEYLELLEFDIELFTGVVNIDPGTKTSIVRLYEFQLKFQGGRCQIKKLQL